MVARTRYKGGVMEKSILTATDALGLHRNLSRCRQINLQARLVSQTGVNKADLELMKFADRIAVIAAEMETSIAETIRAGGWEIKNPSGVLEVLERTQVDPVRKPSRGAKTTKTATKRTTRNG